MGMSRLVLDLPTSCPHREALDTAATELHERGIHGWKSLELRTTESTGTGLIRHFTFTYWVPASTATHPQNISYNDLWARLNHPERSALLRLAPTSSVTDHIRHALVHAVGESFFILDSDGKHHLPHSFRIFLQAVATDSR